MQKPMENIVAMKLYIHDLQSTYVVVIIMAHNNCLVTSAWGLPRAKKADG